MSEMMEFHVKTISRNYDLISIKLIKCKRDDNIIQ